MRHRWGTMGILVWLGAFVGLSLGPARIAGAQIIPLQPRTGGPCVTVFGYLPYWNKTATLRYDLLTHVACFSVGANADGTISNGIGWPWTSVINTAHQNGVKVVLVVTQFDAATSLTLITTPAYKNAFFSNIKAQLLAGKADGLNIDFEGSGTYRSYINGFMADLTAYLHAEVPGCEVTFAGPAVNWSSSWDLVGLAASCDGIFIMGYDFYGSWSSTSGPSSPLTGGSINVTNTVYTQYQQVTQNHPEKLILGIPYYGNHWKTTTADPRSTMIDHVGSVTFATAQAGSQTYGLLWDSVSQTPWYRYHDGTNWHQVWFDNAESLQLKYALARNAGLQGVGMWCLGNDAGRTELWDLLEQEFVTGCQGPLLASYVGQYYPATMMPGSTATAWIEFQNTGSETWQQGQVRLGTSSPQDRSSAFYTAGDWISPQRPAEMDVATCPPGGTCRFTFTLTAPVTTGAYTEYWRPVKENVAWFGPGNVQFQITVTTTPAPTYFMVESRTGGQNFAKYSETGVWADVVQKSGADGVTPGIGCRYGSTYISVAGEKHALFKADLAAAGPYEVFATWPAKTNSRNPVLHRITHAGGTTDVNVDQTAAADVWVSLGTYNFNAGTNTGQVDVNNLNIDVSGSMYADAVKWEYRGSVVQPPVITQQPQNQNPCAGSDAAFQVIATGEGTLSYRWQRNGADLSDGGQYSGTATAALSITGVTAANAGSYACIVSNAAGDTTSNTAMLSVRAATSITQGPASQSVCPGGTAQFSVNATGEGTITFRWQKDGADLSNTGHYSGVTTPTLTISTADGGDAADYRCVVTAGCGSAASSQAALALKAATNITQQPTPASVVQGGTATFTVTATGDGTIAYQWQKDGVDLADDAHYSGATTATLILSGVVKSDAGSYRCTAAGECGSVSSADAVLTVNVPLSMATDFDGDADVDLNDFSFFRMCFSGPNRAIPYPECALADLDDDNDVDLSDFTVFRNCFNGPNRTPACQ